MKSNFYGNNPSVNIFIFLIFLLSPVIAIILYVLCMCLQEENGKYQYYGLFLLLALWLAGMNATKTPASDQIAYKMMYLNVPKYSFGEALIRLNVNTKSNSIESYIEPVYKAVCYIGYYLTFGNPYWFFSLITFIIYIVSFGCIYRLFSLAGYSRITIMAGVFICAFFFQFFNETAHAIRQFLAGCIVLISIIKKNETQKNPWGLYILSLLTHKSTLLFVLLCLIPTNTIEKKKNILMVICITAICTYFMSELSHSFMQLGLQDSYVLRRAAQGSKEFSEMNKWILYGVSLPIIFVCLRALFSVWKETEKIRFFLFIALLLCVFVIFCGKNTLFLGRYFFYLYFIVPFVIPLLLKNDTVYQRYYLYALCSFMPVYFFLSFRTCIWKYAGVLELIFYPYPLLLNYFGT